MELQAGHFSGIVNQDVGVFIAPKERHCFAGSQNNLFLVVDVAARKVPHNNSHAFNLTPSLKKLIQFTHFYLAADDGDLFTESLINPLLVHLATKSFAPKLDQVVIKAKNWIDFYFAEAVNVSHVAKHCHLSVSQLQRRFKQTLGYSIAEYWRLKKLMQAKQLLLSKNSSIEAVALAVGYENVPAFSRRFSKVYGESPFQWKTKALSAKKMRELDNS